MQLLVDSISNGLPLHSQFASVQFAYEMAMMDLKLGGRRMFSDNDFYSGDRGLQINGLVWMGDFDFMSEQVDQKIKAGFECIKIKIGALDWEREWDLLKGIREKFGDSIELRVDANGGFSFDTVRPILESLASINVHSIEQPIPQRQVAEMATLCAEEIVPIALDEELIGVSNKDQKVHLLDSIKPQYIILKPTLVGGFESSNEWIDLAEEREIGWWATSALESNIGLNAIAQWISEKSTKMPQGLGTGGLYTNNIDGPLYIQGDQLYHNPNLSWSHIKES